MQTKLVGAMLLACKVVAKELERSDISIVGKESPLNCLLYLEAFVIIHCSCDIMLTAVKQGVKKLTNHHSLF